MINLSFSSNKIKLACDSIKMIRNKPKLVVFDLDHTLWNLGIDDYYHLPPYRRGSKIPAANEGQKETYKVFDRDGKEMKPYPEVKPLLDFLYYEIKVPIACASRTTDPSNALSLMDLYNWTDYFAMKEIYPGQKFPHFENFKDQSKIPYKDMLFFDDEHRNIKDIGSLNVTCIKVDSYIGMNFDLLKQGFEQHNNKLSKEIKN